MALLPGTSRSGATIVGALILGLSRVCAAEFSFFMAIPAMLGASLIKLLGFGLAFSSEEILCLVVGMLVSFIVSMFAIRMLMNFVSKHDFKPFGYYRIALGIIVIVVAAVGLI